MDMARTSINVVGNCLATVLMARWDGSFVLSAACSTTHIDVPLSSATTCSPMEGSTI